MSSAALAQHAPHSAMDDPGEIERFHDLCSDLMRELLDALAAAPDRPVSVSLFRDRIAAGASDDVALAFVRDELASLSIERSETIDGGEIVVSRVTAALLEPIRV